MYIKNTYSFSYILQRGALGLGWGGSFFCVFLSMVLFMLSFFVVLHHWDRIEQNGNKKKIRVNSQLLLYKQSKHSKQKNNNSKKKKTQFQFKYKSEQTRHERVIRQIQFSYAIQYTIFIDLLFFSLNIPAFFCIYLFHFILTLLLNGYGLWCIMCIRQIVRQDYKKKRKLSTPFSFGWWHIRSFLNCIGQSKCSFIFCYSIHNIQHTMYPHLFATTLKKKDSIKKYIYIYL